MNAEKRKRHCCREDSGKRPKSGKDNGREDEDMTTVTEEEVEEFFTILKRIRVAARHFEKTDGAGRKLTSQKLRLTFEAQDFVEDDEVVNRDDDEDKKAEAISGFDLNYDPAASSES